MHAAVQPCYSTRNQTNTTFMGVALKFVCMPLSDTNSQINNGRVLKF